MLVVASHHGQAGEAFKHAQFEEALVAVEINRQFAPDAVLVLRDRAGRLLVSRQSLERWRLIAPTTAATTVEGEPYFDLTTLPGVRYRYDDAKLALAIDAAPAAFEETAFAPVRRPVPRLATPSPGAFLNYDFAVTRTHSGDTTRAGLAELGVFGIGGVVTSSVVGRDTLEERKVVRLDTTYTRDWPDALQSARAGDVISRPGTWGRPLRLGGLQFGTNFATQPGFVRTPLLNAVGQATLPSVVDVFVNNSFVTRREVPPGPFAVNNIPPIAGAGQVNLIVTDLLGRQQVITQPFYTSATLLAAGTSDYSFEAGRLRRDYGLASNDYGEAAAAATYRYGFRPTMTGEVHAEGAASARTAGGGIDYLVNGSALVLSTHAAASDSASGRGALGIVGVEHQGRRLRIGARGQWSTEGYRQAGELPGEIAIARRVTLNGTIGAGMLGSINVAALRQAMRDGSERTVLSSSYTHQIGRRSFASISLTRSVGTGTNTGVFLMFSMAFGERSTATLNTTQSRTHGADSVRETALSVQRALGPGEDWGYRLLAKDSGDFQGGVQRQHRYGIGSAEVNTLQGDTAVRLGAQGSIGWIGNQTFASRPLTDSFAVVQVPDFPGTRVRHDHQLEGRTDASGVIVLPRLRSYDVNRVSLDAVDLPLDARVDALRINVTPPYRSGVLVPFPVRRERAATVTILLEDGDVLPAGASVQLNEQAEQFPVAFRGEAFISGLRDTNSLRVHWRDQECLIELPTAPADDPVADLGAVVCKGVLR